MSKVQSVCIDACKSLEDKSSTCVDTEHNQIGRPVPYPKDFFGSCFGSDDSYFALRLYVFIKCIHIFLLTPCAEVPLESIGIGTPLVWTSCRGYRNRIT